MVGWVSDEDKVRIKNCIENGLGIRVKIQRVRQIGVRVEGHGVTCVGGWVTGMEAGWGRRLGMKVMPPPWVTINVV